MAGLSTAVGSEVLDEEGEARNDWIDGVWRRGRANKNCEERCEIRSIVKRGRDVHLQPPHPSDV